MITVARQNLSVYAHELKRYRMPLLYQVHSMPQCKMKIRICKKLPWNLNCQQLTRQSNVQCTPFVTAVPTSGSKNVVIKIPRIINLKVSMAHQCFSLTKLKFLSFFIPLFELTGKFSVPVVERIIVHILLAKNLALF
jgi:hypothetical protein